MAGTRYVGCLENVVVPPRELVARALDTITRCGPHTRLGLSPDPRALMWGWQAESAPEVRELPADIADRGSSAVLEYINKAAGPRGPVDVYLSDRHIAFDIDHGLGDARLYVDCVTTIFGLIDGVDTSWLRDRDTANPIAHALLHTFAASPRRLLTTWTEARQRPRPGWHRAAPPPAPTGLPSPAVEVIHVDATLEREVDSWRTADAPGASRAVTWLMIVRTALARAGLPLTDAARLVVDCRRYLPSDDRVNANFISGLSGAAPVDGRLGAIDAAVKQDLEAALPLLALAATSAHTLAVPLRATRGKRPAARSAVQLGYSDVGRLSPFEALPWLPGRPRSINAALQPWAPSDISVFSGKIGHERSITVSYHDNVHDRRLLRKAAEAIGTDPIGLLAGC